MRCHADYDYRRMLHTVRYDPTNDLLIHVGDLLAKGPDSPLVVQSMAYSNVTGVRGNHDQKVIEWRSWIQWVQSHKVRSPTLFSSRRGLNLSSLKMKGRTSMAS